MRRKIVAALIAGIVLTGVIAGCDREDRSANANQADPQVEAELEDVKAVIVASSVQRLQ